LSSFSSQVFTSANDLREGLVVAGLPTG
jgi:hypothetical protein